MATKCANCPLRALDLFRSLSPEQLRFMERFKAGELTVEAQTPLLMEGSNSPQLFTALRGMGIRYKTLANGRRQVLNLVMPGDFIGLQAAVLGEMQHGVEATTRMTLCVFDRNEFWTLFRNHPERAFDVTWMSAMEEHFLGSALTTIGQRTALQAVAWAICHIFQRGEALGLVEGRSMPLPFRQQDLADMLGLSLVHTNKTLSRLRERQLAAWSDGVLQVHDLEGLAVEGVADLDPPGPRALL